MFEWEILVDWGIFVLIDVKLSISSSFFWLVEVVYYIFLLFLG